MGNCLNKSLQDKCEFQTFHYTIYQRGRKVQVPSLQPLCENPLYRQRQKNPKPSNLFKKERSINVATENNGTKRIRVKA